MESFESVECPSWRNESFDFFLLMSAESQMAFWFWLTVVISVVVSILSMFKSCLTWKDLRQAKNLEQELNQEFNERAKELLCAIARNKEGRQS